ncbi:hypothetical protein GOODEAATRI_003876, partial [Goodea atripinnis]
CLCTSPSELADICQQAQPLHGPFFSFMLALAVLFAPPVAPLTPLTHFRVSGRCKCLSRQRCGPETAAGRVLCLLHPVPMLGSASATQDQLRQTRFNVLYLVCLKGWTSIKENN